MWALRRWEEAHKLLLGERITRAVIHELVKQQKVKVAAPTP